MVNSSNMLLLERSGGICLLAWTIVSGLVPTWTFSFCGFPSWGLRKYGSLDPMSRRCGLPKGSKKVLLVLSVLDVEVNLYCQITLEHSFWLWVSKTDGPQVDYQ